MWKKIAGPAAFVVILWIGGGAITTNYILRLQASLTKSLRESTLSVRLAGEMEATQWKLHSAVMEADQYGLPNLSAGGIEAELEFERTLEYMRHAARSEQEIQQIDQIAKSFAQYRSVAHQVLGGDFNGAESQRPELEDTTQLAAQVASECKGYSGLEQRLLAETIDRYFQLTHGVNALRFILFCSGPVFGLLLGVWVMRELRVTSQRHSVQLPDRATGLEKDFAGLELSSIRELPMLSVKVQERNPVAGQLGYRPEPDRGEPAFAAGDLAAGIAHELRNPLTSLKLLIQAAARKQRDRPLSDKQFQILQDEITRMEGSIQSLLDFTRPPKIRRRVHNVCDTLRRSLNLVRNRATQTGVTLLEGLPNERIMVDGDAEQLHQVFVNLLLNAMESMPDGGTMRVAIGGISEDDAMCRIKCSDSGKGIPADSLDRIFEPFVSGKEHGHGLGLAVSRRIVAEHGGSLTAANRPEGGALFTVSLPLISIDPEAKPPSSDPEIPVQRPLSDPDLVARPASDSDLAAQPALGAGVRRG